MEDISRRDFLRAGAALAATGFLLKAAGSLAQSPPGERPRQDKTVEVLNPQGRVPLSFFIDDSTCLVNLGHFCMPQFAEAFPKREIYEKPWKTWPREIPDAFLRQFGLWCAEQGVKGKFSIVPCPACVGWLDRELPGWSRRELLDSLKLVREVMVPHWDIHPEMITHTRVIDLRTGRPMAEIGAATMENSYPQTKKTVDELAAYVAYALRILKNCEIPCEGITTPGGFGGNVKVELSQAVGEAVREVFAAEVPHYFKYVSSGDQSPAPKLEHVTGLDTPSPRFVVSVPAGTGDWYGGWDGDRQPEADRYANEDATSGRMVELIDRGGPAVMLCHWPGLYGNGTKQGFQQCQRVILAINRRYGERTIWMKISELARYWAAKELTRIERSGGRVTLDAPVACPRFTLRAATTGAAQPRLLHAGAPISLSEVDNPRDLKPGTWLREAKGMLVCFDLPKGQTTLNCEAA